MLACDVIKNCNITRVISIYLDGWSDDDELSNREETIAKLYTFWRLVCELTPNPSPDKILIATECYDTCIGTYIASSLYKRDNLEEHLQILQSKEFPVYSADDSAEELRNIYYSLEGWFPKSYDYEVLLWKDMLGIPVIKENIERHGADAVVAGLFYEMMPFHGWRKKIQRTEGIEEEIAGIIRELMDGNMDDAADEDIEEPEEDNKYETCGNNRKAETEKKIEADRKIPWLEALRNYEIELEELKMIYKYRELQNCQKL